MAVVTPTFEENADRWRKRVVIKGGSGEEYARRQRVVAEAAAEGTFSLMKYLHNELNTAAGYLRPGSSIPVPSRRLSAEEMLRPPPQAAALIAETLSDVSPSDAASPAFWTAVHLQWAQNSIIDPQWSRGLVRKDDDATTRSVCRYLGGLPHIRGKTSVLSDCPISAAWWQRRVAARVDAVEDCKLGKERLIEIISGVWRTLSAELVMRVAVMNQPRALAALLTYYNRKDQAGVPTQTVFQEGLFHLAGFAKVMNFDVAPFERMVELCAGSETPDSDGEGGAAEAEADAEE